ncbi:ABC transporter substrate-binding protein [Lampropedia puyangensis]|uniref:ABC transporter substrate-binding protein n=1 Tax=Lampropedia puyangensis TaxID=1330072 RepID=A0A4S8FIX4_9BURK|nr:helical backbone metal receptor [Lampropedia puyangensis]THU05532.1 ABC transporter substrate-binding protein [Lampropedia puyangensis]
MATGGVWSSAAAADAVVVEDDRGQRVAFATTPQRIVSLLPSLTESVCALKACDRLVGVDRYSRYPESVQALPVLGGGLDPNIEAVVARKPDVVLISVSSRASQRLEALGLKVVALEPKTHADVKRVLEVLDSLLYGADAAAAQRAFAVWQTIEQGLQNAAARLPRQAGGLRVYFEVSRGPYGAGPQSFIGETLTVLGLGNVLPADLGPFPRVTPEFILRTDPDILMVSSRSMVPEFQYPGWKNMRAMQQGHVCQFDADEANVLVRPGPRMNEAAELMAQCVARWYGAAQANGAAVVAAPAQ